MPAPTITASVAPSGMGVLFVFRDNLGANDPVASLSTQAEVQSLALAPAYDGTPITLSLGGHATAPINPIAHAPFVHFDWVATGLAPGAYDLAVNIEVAGNNSPATLYEVFDDTAPAGSTTLDLTTLSGLTLVSDPSVDGRSLGMNWPSLGRFTVSSGTLRVRVSAPVGTSGGVVVFADTLRYVPAAGGTVRYVGPAVPPGAHANPLANYDTFSSDVLAKDGGPAWHDLGGGAGTYYAFDPAAVQAALEALPNVGAGNVTVAGNGWLTVVNYATVATPLVVTFAGSLARASLPLIASTEAHLTIARLAEGGNWPSIRVDGGSPIPLDSLCGSTPFWGMGHGNLNDPADRTSGPYLPYIYFPFLQSADDVEFFPIGSWGNVTADGTGSGWPLVGSGYSPVGSGNTLAVKSLGAGGHATWVNEGRPTATYRLSATWTADAGNTTDAVYAITNRAGTTLATYHVDQTAGPGGAGDHGVPWRVLGSTTTTAFVDDLTVTMTNGSTGYMVADAIRWERTSPDTSFRIAPGSVVTGSWGFGWAVTVGGSAAAAADVAVANRAGGQICPAVGDEPKTMGIGWNINYTYTSTAVRPHANLMAGWSARDRPGLDRDADGYPTRFPGPTTGSSASFSVDLASPFNTQGGLLNGGADVPSGHYAVLWRGSDSVRLNGAEVGTESTATDGRRVRVFDFQPIPGWYSPSVAVSLTSTTMDGPGSWTLDVTDLAVYSPGIDYNAPPKFNPGFLAKVAGVQVLRFLDPIGGIQGNNVTFADFQPAQSWITRSNQPQRIVDFGIASVTAYPFAGIGGVHPYDPAGGPAYLFATKTPHGMSERMTILIGAEPGPFPLSDGSHQPVAGWGPAPVHVIDDTHFSLQFVADRPPTDGDGNVIGDPIAMVGTVGDVGGTASWAGGNSFPVADMVEICNLAGGGHGANIHLNINITANDDALTALGDYLARNLAAGRKVFLECGNEPWNTYVPPYQALVEGSYVAGHGSDMVPYYCELSAHFWGAVRGGMEAAVPGRGADLVGTLGGCGGNPAYAARYADYFAAHPGITQPNAVANAPYITNAPSGGPFCEIPLTDLVDQFPAAQQLDCLEAATTYTDRVGDAHATRGALDGQGMTAVALINYEGGPSGLAMSGPPVQGRKISRQSRRAHAIVRHPRLDAILRAHFQAEQDAGVSSYSLYYLAGGGDYLDSAWSAYTATDQPDGTGNPTLDADNIATPDRMDLIKSQTGGSVSRWAAQVGASAPTSSGPRHGRNRAALRRLRRST